MNWDVKIRNLALAVLFLTASVSVWRVQQAVVDSLTELPDQVHTEISQSRAEILAHLQDLEAQVLQRVDHTTHRVDRQLSQTQQGVFSRLDRLDAQAFREIRELNQELQASLGKVTTQTGEVSASIQALSTQYQTLPHTVNQVVGAFSENLNCDINDLCWPHLTQDVLLDTRAAMRTFNTQFPRITNNVVAASSAVATQTPLITNNITDITSNLNRMTRPRWWDRAISWGVSGSLIYLNIKR